jgi:hypothetical protein
MHGINKELIENGRKVSVLWTVTALPVKQTGSISYLDWENRFPLVSAISCAEHSSVGHIIYKHEHKVSRPVDTQSHRTLLYRIDVKHLNVNYKSHYPGRGVELRWKMRSTSISVDPLVRSAEKSLPLSLPTKKLVRRTGYEVIFRDSLLSDDSVVAVTSELVDGSLLLSPFDAYSPWTACSAMLSNIPLNGVMEIWVLTVKRKKLGKALPTPRSTSSGKCVINHLTRCISSSCDAKSIEGNDLIVRNIPQDGFHCLGGDMIESSWSPALREALTLQNSLELVPRIVGLPGGHKVLRIMNWYTDPLITENGKRYAVEWNCKLQGGNSESDRVEFGSAMATTGYEWSVCVSRAHSMFTSCEIIATGCSDARHVGASGMENNMFQWCPVRATLHHPIFQGDQVIITGMPAVITVTSEGSSARPLLKTDFTVMVKDCQINAYVPQSDIMDEKLLAGPESRSSLHEYCMDMTLSGTILNCTDVRW